MNMITDNQRGMAAADPRSERLDVDELLQVMRRNLWVIILIALAVTGATAAYLSTRIPVFSTHAAMVLTNSEIRMSQIDTQLQSYELTRTRVETELDVLRSRSFSEQVAKSIGLFQNTEFLPIKPGDPVPGTPQRGRAVVDKLLDSYALHRSGESLVITVQADATTPELAASIANGVVVSFIEMSRSKQTSIIDRLTFHLNKQITEMGESLALRQLQLADFIREHALDDPELPERLRREEDHLASVLAVMASDGRETSAEGQRMTTSLEGVRQQLADRTRADLELGRMHRAVELLSTRYQNAGERLSDLERQRDLVQPDARQITSAELPFSPAWPNFTSTLALAFPAGLVLAVVATLLRSTVSQQVWDSSQLARISDVPNLGLVPHIRRRGLLMRRQEPATFLPGHPRSSYGEAMRSLVSIWSGQPGQVSQSRLLMITSGLPGEGRTTIAVSMAATAALEGMRVLLLDMHTGNHGASRSLGVTPGAASFAHVIDGFTSIPDAVQQVENYTGFDLMAFQNGTQLTPRILHRFVTDILIKLRESYDLIILDTPPALAIADAVRLATIADEALLVVRAGKTNLRTVRSSLDKMRISGVQVAGVVINDVSAARYHLLNEGSKHD